MSESSEPYVRIWLEQPSNTEVAMLLASDYRQLCTDLEAARSEIERLNRHLTTRVSIAEEVERRHDAISRIGNKLALAQTEIERLKRGATEVDEFFKNFDGVICSCHETDSCCECCDVARTYRHGLAQKEIEVAHITAAAHRFEEEARQATFAQEHMRAVVEALSPVTFGLQHDCDIGTATEHMETRDWDALAKALLDLAKEAT